MVIFKSMLKKLETDLRIKLCSKRLYPAESVKHLGVKIDTNLSWQYHVNDLTITLNRANALLFKIRKYVCLKILRSIYFAIFDSYLSYCCLVCQFFKHGLVYPQISITMKNLHNSSSTQGNLIKRFYKTNRYAGFDLTSHDSGFTMKF